MNDEEKIFQFMPKFCKYDGKPIKFIDKKDHYELIFVSSFNPSDEQFPIYNDLLIDLKEADKTKEIHIWINSQGGSVSTLMLLTQLIEQFEYIVTIGTGEIDSCGFMLWAIGDERYLHPKSFCMYHSMSSGNHGKTEQLKNFGIFIERYQQFFAEDLIKKTILTQEEFKQGKFTQIWLLGMDLIERGAAINYSEYKNRQSMMKIEGFKMDESFYVKDVQGKYYECLLISNGQEKRELMKTYLQNLKTNQKKTNEIVEKIGQEFIDFVQDWIRLKGRVLQGDGFISNDLLYEDYCGMCEPITLTEIKKKLKEWCQLVGLQYINSVKKNNKKGFSIKLKKQDDNENINISEIQLCS